MKKIKKANEEKKRETINQKTILEEYGWSKKLIEKYLPEPMFKRNPIYACAPEMKLWYRDEVEAIMKKDEFKEDMKKVERRREAAEKAIYTKEEKTETMTEQYISELKLDNMSYEDLTDYTLGTKQAYYNSYGNYSNVDYADEETKERWMVNHARHYLTNYDEILGEIKGAVGVDSAYIRLKEAILDMIAEKYPQLKEECERQKRGISKALIRKYMRSHRY